MIAFDEIYYLRKSTKTQISPSLSEHLNKLMLWVRPGVLLSTASFLFIPVKQFSNELFPTFERPKFQKCNASKLHNHCTNFISLKACACLQMQFQAVTVQGDLTLICMNQQMKIIWGFVC